MKKLYAIIPALFCIIHFPLAQDNDASGATLLFGKIKSKLTTEQKSEIFSKTGFYISKDKKQFVTGTSPDEDYPFEAFVYPLDLNADGKEEVCIVFGNTFTSGQAGSSVLLLVADKAGQYQLNLGFPGVLPDALPTKNLGYPDLLIGGPDFTLPIYKWNGKEYVLLKSISEKDIAKLKTSSLEDLSKTYQESIK
jgi:hypothetical protein